MGDELPRWVARVIILLLLLPTLYIGGTAQAEAPKPILEQLTNNELITYYAKHYKVNEDLARDIIRCESNFNEDALNTKAVVGEDVGLFQLNSYYWQLHMAERGWDIYNTKDNIQAGMWLLSNSGSSPWVWSEHCWNR